MTPTSTTPTAPPPNLRAFVESARFEAAILAVIVLNSIVLGLETVPAVHQAHGSWLGLLDRVMLGIFVIELALKLAVYGRAFPRDPWRLFDAVVVTIALVPAAGPFAVLRALRALRVLRLVTVLPAMRRVVSGLLAAVPGIGSVAGIMAIIYYVGAVIATQLFGQAFPEWFGNLGKSAYTLFQIMTLESWSMGIVRPVMERYPYAWAFFVPYILVATFTMLNLFIAVIVNAMQAATHAEVADLGEAAHDEREDILLEVQGLRAEIRSLRDALAERRAD